MNKISRGVLCFVVFLLWTTPVFADETPPVISSISTSDTTSSSITITWTTDENANSEIEYGTTNEYGSTITKATLETSHSLTISGLSANTTYHYVIKSSDESENRAESDDRTFTTSSSSSSSSSTTASATSTPKPTSTPTPTPDRVPPSITVTTDFSKPFSGAPTITGSCSDISGVQSISYSIDGGETFVAVDEMKAPNTTKTAFSFTPIGLEDGNYTIKIRASDAKGNTGTSKGSVLIIDRLPPMVGTHLVHLGPQLLFPEGSMALTILSSRPHRITLSAVGGPLDVSLFAYGAGEPSSSARLIPLMKNPVTSFWSGSLDVATPGSYRLFTKTYDGAGHATTRTLGPLHVIAAGSVTDGTQAIPGAVVSLFVRSPDTSRLTLWDATAWDQSNPQTVGQDGRYSFIAPPGTYVLQAEAAGYVTKKTSFFPVTRSQAITSPIVLGRQRTMRIGPWKILLPPFSETVAFAPPIHPSSDQDPSDSQQSLIGHELPPMSLQLDDEPVTDLSLRGTPTILSFLTTWSPVTPQQLQELEQIPTSDTLRVAAVFPQESSHSIALYKKRGNYSTLMGADPDGTLVEPLQLHLLPTHIILDRRGIITHIAVGVLKKEELLKFVIQ